MRQWTSVPVDKAHSPISSHRGQATLVLLMPLMIMLHLVTAVTEVRRSCLQQGACLGSRPLTPVGCCPRGAGDDCGAELGLECDTDLGYQCLDSLGNISSQRGLCAGRYHVHVTEKQTSSVSLAWSDFKPNGYTYEYVLLYHQGNYVEDRDAWELLDIGTQPNYTVTKLSPATLYSMQLAVWADVRNNTLGDRSEVLWVTTQAVSHCSHNGQEFEVGQVIDNCEDRCTCLSTGLMECTPLCPETELPEVREGCSLVFEEGCPCNATERCPSEEGESGCHYKGGFYNSGNVWTDTTDCATCTCEAGHANCHFLCNEELDPMAECINPVRRPVEAGCCEITVCDTTEGRVDGEEECNHNDTVYNLGDTFTEDCSLCMCVQDNSISCSFDTCSPVEMLLPSIVCPFPHVRRDGCCDMVFCEESNQDPDALLSRLMAISFAPNSLTVSFDVTRSTAQDLVRQDRYEVLMSDQDGNFTSWMSRTYTLTTVDADGNASTPAELLHADEAIRVDDRVYITVNGLSSNTRYYVRVQPLVKRDMGVTESERNNVTLIGSIVVRTLQEAVTCQVGNKTYQEGDNVSESCREICTCTTGQLRCRSLCPEEAMVMTSSATCPRPRLVQSGQSCCQTWKCFPEEDGCVHNDVFLKNGEQVYEGLCDRKCRCTAGEVVCTPVCLPPSAAPNVKCVLTNVTGACCPVWFCPRDVQPPVEMSLAFRVGFRGACSDQEAFKTSLRGAFTASLVGRVPCADKESPFYVSCWVREMLITCPVLDAQRSRRQTTEIELFIIMSANITNANTVSQVETALNATRSALFSMYASPDVWLLLDKGQNLTSSGNFLFFGVYLSCAKGFLLQHNVCVSDHSSSSASPSQGQNVSMTLVESTYDSAALAWEPLSGNSLTYVVGIVIEYREATSVHWNQTVTLPPTSVNHTVTYLRPLHTYQVRLTALTKWTPPEQRIPLTLLQFTTKNHEVLTRPLIFDPLQVSFSRSSVVISWMSFTDDVISAIIRMQITYRKSQDTNASISRDIDPRDSNVTLTGLTPGTAYVSRFVVHIVNGTIITTRPLHFVSALEDSLDVPLVPLLATCAVMVMLSILLPIAFFVWRRMRRKTILCTAFENKAFGVTKPITSLCSSRAKNEAARPQDLESGSVAASSADAADCRAQA